MFKDRGRRGRGKRGVVKRGVAKKRVGGVSMWKALYVSKRSIGICTSTEREWAYNTTHSYCIGYDHTLGVLKDV